MIKPILCCIFVSLVVANALLLPTIKKIMPVKKGKLFLTARGLPWHDLTNTALPRVSLDKAIMPRTSNIDVLAAASGASIMLTTFLYCVMASVAARRFAETRGAVGTTYDLMHIQTSVDAVTSFLHRMQHLLPFQSAHMSKHAKTILSADKWTVWVLAKIEEMDKEWLLYHFQVGDGREGSIVELDIGEQVTLCLADFRGRRIKKSFFPVPGAPARACVEVLVRRPSATGMNSTPEEDFDATLRTLRVGDEVAMKKGLRRVQLPSINTPILQLVLLASGDGVFPALQLLRAIAADPETTVEQVDLLWINDNKRDFTFNREIEQHQQKQLAKGSGPRLRVVRIVDRELGNPATLLNEELLHALPEHRAGAVGLVLAEGAAATKCRGLLKTKGYKDACISGFSDTQS